MKEENNILELTPEFLEYWKNSFSGEFVYPEKENKEPKKLKGKLFSRENIEKSKGEDFDDLLWPRIII